MSPRMVSTDHLVETAISQWSRARGEGGVTLVNLGGDSTTVHVDSARIGQVMDNLLANALRHTPAGGHISVRTTTTGGVVAIEVSDDGDGISPGGLPHVMERFYRSDPARTDTDGSGTGVGLPISRAVARAHGGDLSAHSDGQGCGATFTVTLPSSPNLHR